MDLSKWVDNTLSACLGKMDFVDEFLFRKTSKLAGDVVGSVFSYLVLLFVALIRQFFRMDEKRSSCSLATTVPNSLFDSVVKSEESEAAELFSNDSSEEEASPELVFKFQSYQEFCKNKGEDDSSIAYQPVSFCKFLDQSANMELDVKLNSWSEKVGTLESGAGLSDGFLRSKYFVQNLEVEYFQIDPSEGKDLKMEVESVEGDVEEEAELSGKCESLESLKNNDFVQEEECFQIYRSEGEELEIKEGCVEVVVEQEAELSGKCESSESMVSGNEVVDMSCVNESVTNVFLSEGEFMPYLEQCIDIDESSLKSSEHDEVEALKELQNLLKSQSKERTVENEKVTFDDNESDDLFKKPDSKNAEDVLGSDFLSDEDFGSNQEIPDSETDTNFGNEELETLWEHQHILEQLSFELRSVRATGLSTIDEHTEISKFSENLKPWKIEEKFQPGYMFSMVHKFYRSYWEKMRKLDILSYQKMYAFGLLQSKEALRSGTGDKSDTQALALFKSLWRNKNRKIEAEPMMKFVGELHSDLELIYVGQMCLSWDILHWQYEKALELWEADPHGLRIFNLVCTEFQQFQVLLQRFLEDEQHQGPRVESYVKCRRGSHNLLLQVPVIREDKRGKGKVSPSSDALVEKMEESIRTFLKFLTADKQGPTGKKPVRCELHDSADTELVLELTKTLQKKERKLRDLSRTRSRILKKFKRRREDHHSDEVVCFLSQVYIRLVARVLRMSRLTTDQLHWCENKLSSINFVKGRIQVEPAFSLFPC